VNFDKTQCIQFTATNISQVDLEIIYTNKLISKTYDAMLIGIYAVDSTLAWGIHTEKCAHK
jgi:hypothetical protein